MCTGKESVEVINSFFTNIGPNLNNKLPPSSDTNTIQESDVSLENIEISSNENVAALVKDIDICKSSGVSDVSSRLLKDGFIALIEQLTFILNLSLKTGVFPDVWKVARVRPIPKTGDLTNVNNIRPISLTALPGKLLERYIHTNLVYFLEENKLLCKNQGGFRKKRSTTRRGSRGGGGRDPPCSRPPIFFFNKPFDYSKKKLKKKSLGIFYGCYVP